MKVSGVETIIIYDDWKPIAEWDGWTEEYFQAWNVYGPGADEILLRQAGRWGYVRYHSDPNGNVKFLLDNNGRVVEKYTYDAFGRPKIMGPEGEVRTSSHYDNRFLFQGREYIGELGVYDYRNRFYHPDLGRFLQIDPTGFDGGDMNLFRYCGDDPIDGSDPTGLVGQFDRLTSDQGGEWITGANGLSDLDKMNHFPAGNITMGLVEKNEGEKSGSTKENSKKETGGSEITVTRSIASQEQRRLWFVVQFYRGLITWRYVFTDASGNPVAGARVDETISYGKSSMFVPRRPRTGRGFTHSDGSIPDNYGATFLSPKGYVTINQTVKMEGAGQAQWSGVLHADGTYTTTDPMTLTLR